MKQFGLIGYPLTHSFSKKYFEEKFRRENITGCQYDLFPFENIAQLPALVKSHPQLKGLNVTIPYKESVISFLDELNETAQQIGAVNCITISAGKLKGYNTDCYGFQKSLEKFLTASPNICFVLGTGGSSKAVCFVLQQLNIPFIQVSRISKPQCITYDALPRHLKATNLFINTTPLGMFPDTEACPPLPYHKFTSSDFLFDLVYNPAQTLFLANGKKQGCAIKNGLEMLQLQAEKSWEIWNS
jgi:shikimate dehydrogenase